MAQRAPGQVPPYYAWLGVSPEVSATALQRRYRQLSLQLHPDRAAYRDDPDKEHEVQRRFQHITEAYNVLSDPALRAAYDTRHSVNFRGRASAVQAAIRQHNDQTAHRTSAATAVRTEDEAREETNSEDVSPSASTSTADADASPSPKRRRSAASTDDDDDYDPHPTRSAGPSCSDVTQSGESARRAAVIMAQPLRRLFSLHPRRPVNREGRPCASTSATASPASSLQQQHWRTVVVTRPSRRDSWGLLLHCNLLLGCDTVAPFPARIIKVNDNAVDMASDVATMLAVDHDDALKLTLGLTYNVAEYELADHYDLLRDVAVLSRLVPHTPGAPATLAEELLSGACVVSVNGVCVMDAAELHDELRICADAHEASILLGYATLDGLPHDADELS